MRRIAVLAALLIVATAAGASAAVRTGPAGLAFYKPPGHLAGKAHGGMIWFRRQRTGVLRPAARNELVLYRSIGADGKAIAVSGSVTVPGGRPPKGGWPIVTWAHGTTGIADACAPTRTPLTYTDSYFRAWLKAGYAVVRTDYQGLGTPGTHLYLVGLEEGRSVLDIARAARQLEPGLGRRVIIAGHSQGGHAALWAAALAPKWTPELDVKGTVALAPASHIEAQAKLVSTLNSPIGGLTGLAALIFRGADSWQPSLHLTTLLTPTGAALYPQTLTKCIGALGQAFGSVAPANLFQTNADLTPVLTVLGKSDPEHLRIRTPLFVAQGTSDSTVFPQYTDQLVRQLTAKGAKVDYHHYPGINHVGVAAASQTDALAWARAEIKKH